MYKHLGYGIMPRKKGKGGVNTDFRNVQRNPPEHDITGCKKKPQPNLLMDRLFRYSRGAKYPILSRPERSKRYTSASTER
jgi:hypothetical protein